MASGERLPRDTREPSAERSLRGTGRRRHSEAAPANPNPLRSNPVRRKPVPSTVYESSPRQSLVNPSNAQSSAAKEIGREQSPPTPGVDDTPYIQFALDQLTRDEEVRGSRNYPGQQSQSLLRMAPREQGMMEPSPPMEKVRRMSSPRFPVDEYDLPEDEIEKADRGTERFQRSQRDQGESIMNRPRWHPLPPPAIFTGRSEEVPAVTAPPAMAPAVIPPRHPDHSVMPELRTRSM